MHACKTRWETTSISSNLLQIPLNSETGRRWFRRARFQTPSSLSFLGTHRALTEFWGESLVNLFQLILVCQSELTEFFGELGEFSLPISALETVFRPFP